MRLARPSTEGRFREKRAGRRKTKLKECFLSTGVRRWAAGRSSVHCDILRCFAVDSSGKVARSPAARLALQRRGKKPTYRVQSERRGEEGRNKTDLQPEGRAGQGRAGQGTAGAGQAAITAHQLNCRILELELELDIHPSHSVTSQSF